MSEPPTTPAPRSDSSATGLLGVLGFLVAVVALLVWFSSRPSPGGGTTNAPSTPPVTPAPTPPQGLPPRAPSSPEPALPPAPPAPPAPAPNGPVAAPEPPPPAPPPGTGEQDAGAANNSPEAMAFRAHVDGVRALWHRFHELEAQARDGGSPEQARAQSVALLAEARDQLTYVTGTLPGGASRLEEYRTARDALQANTALPPRAQSEAVFALHNRLFPGVEADRVELVDMLDSLLRNTPDAGAR